MIRFTAIHLLQHKHKYAKFLKSIVLRIKIKQNKGQSNPSPKIIAFLKPLVGCMILWSSLDQEVTMLQKHIARNK